MFLKKWIYKSRNKARKKNNTSKLRDWNELLISLYIVRNTDGLCLYSHHFQLGSISHIEIQLVGMGFSAMSKMMQEVVDSNCQLSLIDLKGSKVLIEEKGNLLGILITTENSPILRSKLIKLMIQFEKIFQLQTGIDELGKHVCLEDYALTSDLVTLIFNKKPQRVLEIIPIIFKSIRESKSEVYSRSFKEHIKNLIPLEN